MIWQVFKNLDSYAQVQVRRFLPKELLHSSLYSVRGTSYKNCFKRGSYFYWSPNLILLSATLIEK